MKAALQRPDRAPAPGELICYQLERQFAERFNVPGVPLRYWPARKVSDFAVIMQVEAEVEREANQQSAKPGIGGSAPPPASASPATEEAYQRLRAQAQPPPTPPPAT